MSLPLALLPWFTPPYLIETDDGLVPNVGGKIYTRDTDLTTPVTVYQDQDGSSDHTNPIIIDADGWIPSNAIYIPPQGISIIYKDADDVTIRTIDFIEDVGSAFLDQSGVIQATGTVATSSPYLVQATDNCVIVDSATTPFVVQLQAAADRGTPLLVKNISSGVTVRVTPESPEAIDSIAAYVELGPFVAPPAPLMMLLSDGVSAWIIASYYNG